MQYYLLGVSKLQVQLRLFSIFFSTAEHPCLFRWVGGSAYLPVGLMHQLLATVPILPPPPP